jgi:hypothetical protein
VEIAGHEVLAGAPLAEDQDRLGMFHRKSRDEHLVQGADQALGGMGAAQDLWGVLLGLVGGQLPLEMPGLELLAEEVAEDLAGRRRPALQPGEVAGVIGIDQAGALQVEHGQGATARQVRDGGADHAVGAGRKRRGARGLGMQARILDQHRTALGEHLADHRGADAPGRFPLLTSPELLRRQCPQSVDRA